MLEDLIFFEDGIAEECIPALMNGECTACLVRPKEEDFDEDIDQLVLQAAFGPSKMPPGDEDSVARKVLGPLEEDGPDIDGLWVPTNSLSKAMAIHLIFPEETKNYILEEPEPPPPVVAVAFDAHKRREIFEKIKEYPQEILKSGFFTSVDADRTVLVSKTLEEFESKPAFTYTEKMVLMVAKTRMEPLMGLVDLGPCYISPNTVAGEAECNVFFPEGYDAPEVVEKKQEKKSSKKKKKQGADKAHSQRPSSPETAAGDLETSGLMEEIENETLLDAATSPMLDAADPSTDIETSLLPEEEGEISD